MSNLHFKEEFLLVNDFSDSITKAYKVVFKKIEPLECKLKKDVKDFNEKDIDKLLKVLSSKSYHSMNVKWSLIKKYMGAYNNGFCENVSQETLQKYIKDSVNTSRYISRKTLQNRIKNLANPQDKALLLLLFEGLFGHKYDEILNLQVSDIDLDNNIINVNNRIVTISGYTKDVLRETLNKKEYYKNFSVGSHDMTTNESYDININSSYLIRTKPSKRTNNGLAKLGVEGFKSKMGKLTEEIGLSNCSALTIFHSGLIEKVLEREIERKKELSISEIKKMITDLGAKKIQPASLKKAVELYKKNYKI